MDGSMKLPTSIQIGNRRAPPQLDRIRKRVLKTIETASHVNRLKTGSWQGRAITTGA